MRHGWIRGLLRAGLVLGLAGPAWAASPIQVTDVAGRTVTVPQPVERFIVSEGRYIPLLAMLRPDQPVAGLVGTMSGLGATYPDLEAQLFERFPAARDIPRFGHRSADTVSVEKIIDLAPQVAIFGLDDHGPGATNAGIVEHLEAAGIKVVFIDFRLDPLNHTLPSIELVGRVLGETQRAGDYAALYREHLAAVKKRVASVSMRPRVFLQVHPGRFECCWGMAEGMLGPFVPLAGGDNIASAVAPGPTAQHSPEFLITENPDVWIGTASGQVSEYRAGKSPVALGTGMTPDMAVDSLARYLDQPAFRALDAVRQGRAHSIWHNFYNSPFNIVALEAFAKWIHPGHFENLDPTRTLQQIYDTYLPFELNGTYFSTIPPTSNDE